ncbi:MAG: hypothetical protein ACRCVN_03215 [Spirochaetia bacterium]
MFLLIWTSLRRFFENISFSHSERLLCQKINNAQALPLIINQPMHSDLNPLEKGLAHTGSLAETYASIFYALQDSRIEKRKSALMTLVQMWNASTGIALPINKSRLRLHLIKKILQTKSHFHQQLAYLRYFQKTVACSQTKLRHLLHIFGLSEIQEKPLSHVEPYVFDNYIINNINDKERTLSLLMCDLFIQGINEATLVTPTMLSKEAMEEIYESAALLKIRIRIGMPFDTYQDGYPAKCLAVLPHFSSGHALLKFYTKHQIVLASFSQSLEKAQSDRIKLMKKSIKEFNRYHLSSCNEHYTDSQRPYFLEPLDIQEFFEEYNEKTSTEMHLAAHLYKKYKRVLLNRILLIKEIRKNPHAFDSSWNIELKRNEWQNIKTLCQTLSPYRLLKQYFSETLTEPTIPTLFHLSEIGCMFRSFGGYICLLPPTKFEEKSCNFFLRKNVHLLDRIEVYNNLDAVNKSLSEILAFMGIVHDYQHQPQTGHMPSLTCGTHALAMEDCMSVGFFVQKKLKNISTFTSIPLPILQAILKEQPSHALLHFPAEIYIHKRLPEENTQSHRPSYISQILNLSSYINPIFMRIALSLFALLVASHYIPVATAVVIFLLTGIYISLLRTQLIEQPCVEEEQATFSMIPKMLFILALLMPAQVKIFHLFYADWLSFIPSFLLIFFQLFALNLINVGFLLILFICYKNLRNSLKNPIYCAILAWPATSILMLLPPVMSMHPGLLITGVTAILGIASSLLGYLKYTRAQNREILSHLLHNFTSQNTNDRRAHALLNLLYFIPRHLGIARYWKKILWTKSQDKEIQMLVKDSQILKDWINDPKRYSEILAWMTQHYPATRINEIAEKTLDNWKKLKRILAQ